MATVRTEALMGTLVTIHVVGPYNVHAAVERAFEWFRAVEERCTRFDERSELRQLTAQPGIAVPASPILYEAVQFALMVAEESGGAFDPTVGGREEDTSFRDVTLDPKRRTIRLNRALTLDLGAVAKGLAVDLAARELEPYQDFAIDAGGDLYFGGLNEDGEPWRVGIRHPRNDGELIETLRASNEAVCTSGDYENPGHIFDPRVSGAADVVASVTVIAAGAMLADALATAAFVLGPAEGISFLDRMGVEGLIVTPQLKRCETQGLRHAA